VRGFGDPRPLGLPGGENVFNQPLNPGYHAGGHVRPFRLDGAKTKAESMQGLDHSWRGDLRDWSHFDVWVPKKTALTMGYFTREDIPFYYALADAFTICDAYYCSLHGPTDPNRMFLFTGTSG
jgi:phospholipase C